MISRYYEEQVRLAERLFPTKTKEEIDRYIQICEESRTYYEKLELINLLYNFKLLKLEMKYEEKILECEENYVGFDLDTQESKFSEITSDWDREIHYETLRAEELRRRAFEEYSKRKE